jgi:hypothetical protein
MKRVSFCACAEANQAKSATTLPKAKSFRDNDDGILSACAKIFQLCPNGGERLLKGME